MSIGIGKVALSYAVAIVVTLMSNDIKIFKGKG